MPTTKHFIVKVKRPLAAKVDEVAGKPKPTPKPKAKKPKGPAQTPPKNPRKPKPRDLLRAQGLDFYHFVQPIELFDRWCTLLAALDAPRPNAILTEWIKADIAAREVQLADRDNRKE